MKNTAQKTHVSTKYQVVIPKAIRQKLHILPSDTLYVYSQDGHSIIMSKVPSYKKLKGSAKFPKNYLKNERLSW